FQPKILVWTPSMTTRNSADSNFLRWMIDLGKQCPFACKIDGRERMTEENASAIIFHSRAMTADDLPKRRKGNQI
ncbi:hypothetical protein PMAYCL1PPCAC_21580, partial [Pristionchus mayeri]